MRRKLLVGLLIVSIAMPGIVLPGVGRAASSSALPYNLELSSPLGFVAKTDTVLSGSTFGGVPVKGTVSGTFTSGTLTLVTDGKVFVNGTYTCSSACTFTGTVAGQSVTGMMLTASRLPNGTTVLTTVGRATSSAFPNHGAWVSAVAGWAKANLIGRQRGQVISAAARIEGARGRVTGRTASGRGSRLAGGHSRGSSAIINGDRDDRVAARDPDDRFRGRPFGKR